MIVKLTVIGGAGVRTPRLIPALVKRAQRLQLQELWLMDINPTKLDLIGSLCIEIAHQLNAPFKIILTVHPEDAIRDADHIVTTIRPGFEQGRAIDEKIAFRHGILGQETTGAGGFAMAMRSIPAILHYCQLAEKLAPDAWIYNFTNPAGLVVQALHYAGIQRVVGICDSANGAQNAASQYFDVPIHQVRHEVFGLNHLSWTRSVRLYTEASAPNGEEVLPRLLDDSRFISLTHMSMFHPIIREHKHMFLNEYLHYFYHRDEALKALLSKTESRGEEVVRLTTELLEKLEEIPPSKHPSQALNIYHEVMEKRNASYMAHARHNEPRKNIKPHSEDSEGYAGVALGCIESLASNTPHFTGLNVPNNGAITGLRNDDIIEVSCTVNSSGIQPIHIGNIPESEFSLVQSVKQYERLAAQSILKRSRDLAIEALVAHPLVGSYPLSIRLIDEFINAHRNDVGDWSPRV